MPTGVIKVAKPVLCAVARKQDKFISARADKPFAQLEFQFVVGVFRYCEKRIWR